MKPVSARQQAQQFKAQRFDKVIDDIARSKPFFMSFVRRPYMQTPEGFGLLLTELGQCKAGTTYEDMVKQYEKRTEDHTKLKRQQENAEKRQ